MTAIGEVAAVTIDAVRDAAPTWVVSADDVPVMLDASRAVTVLDTPAVVGTVYVTVAMPLAFVVDVAVEKVPPVPLADHVTTRPEVSTLLPCASTS